MILLLNLFVVGVIDFGLDYVVDLLLSPLITLEIIEFEILKVMQMASALDECFQLQIVLFCPFLSVFRKLFE